jgi:restriction system protein
MTGEHLMDRIAFKAHLSIARPAKAKQMVAQLLREKGYQIRRAGRGKDRGVDMILSGAGKRIALVLKLHSKRVGAGEVQKAFGAAEEVRADECWLFSSKGFTDEAEEAADKIGVRCLDSERLWRLRSVSPGVLVMRGA